jgi:glycosyltransferase involved in cell wall biosynthesis
VQQREFVFCIAHRAKPTYVALLSNKLPVISVHHNYGDFGRFSRRLIVNLFRNRLLLLGVSNSVRDEMRLSLPKWPQEKIQTLYNHIDIKKVQSALVSKSEARIVLKLPQDAWVIGNVGRLHHDKDQATLIKGFAKALPQLPKDSLLVIIGSGPLESSLKQLALELQVTEHVVFTGQVQNARHYFKAFDVFALTSDCEPFGMVLLEAMAAGVTVICSDCGGGVEVIRGVGELFEFGNVAALSGCIVKMAYKKGKIDEFSMSQKLKDNFSDEAGKKNFWSLPQFDSNNRLTLKNF